MDVCYWCSTEPPCPHVSIERQEVGLLELRGAVNLIRMHPSRLDQLKIKWVRWFHAPSDATEKWCNCGRPYPCRTRQEVIG